MLSNWNNLLCVNVWWESTIGAFAPSQQSRTPVKWENTCGRSCTAVLQIYAAWLLPRTNRYVCYLCCVLQFMSVCVGGSATIYRSFETIEGAIRHNVLPLIICCLPINNPLFLLSTRFGWTTNNNNNEFTIWTTAILSRFRLRSTTTNQRSQVSLVCCRI